MQIMYAGVLGTAMLLQAQMTERSVKTQYLACSPERQFAHAERLRGSGDTSGLRAFTRGALLSGTCISLSRVLRSLPSARAKVKASSGFDRKAHSKPFSLQSRLSTEPAQTVAL